MIGIYNYTVLLTYFSLFSGCLGIVFSLSGGEYSNLGIFFLLFCGLCDGFDGIVANTKVNRTSYEKKFGIQIDTLADLVSFGLLPFSIGISIYRTSNFLQNLSSFLFVEMIIYAVLLFYVLSALIRLAHFNVTEEERQQKEGGIRKYYTGLPVTSASIILPLVVLLQYIVPMDVSILYFIIIFIMAFLFISKFRIKKLSLK